MGLFRFILAISVLTSHFGALFNFKFVGGQIAVQSFYIISGFYITLGLNEKYINKNSSYFLFITNRFFKIYPLYWLVLLFTILLTLLIEIKSKGQTETILDLYINAHPNLFSFSFLILSNLFIFFQDVVMFLGINTVDGHLFFTKIFLYTHPQLHSFLFIPQAWSLSLELMFYLVAPFLVKRKNIFVFSVILISLTIRFLTYKYFKCDTDPWTYRFFPTELMFFLSGFFSYKLYCKIRHIKLNDFIIITMMLYLFLFTFYFLKIEIFNFNVVVFSFKETVYFMSVILILPFLFKKFNTSKFDYFLGELSFPIYISHIFIGMICTRLPFGNFKYSYSVCVGTIIFSIFINKFFLKRIENYRQLRLKK